jgi:predicted lactoylglutathione lyase
MKTNIFINLPVKDLEKSKKFFGTLGYQFNPQFTNDKAACMVIEENIYAMLVTEPFFKQLTKRDVVDNSKGVETATCLSMESRAKVDEWVSKALAAGATENIVPEMSVGETMYGKSINDLDGHIWEGMWMDPKMVQ